MRLFALFTLLCLILSILVSVPFLLLPVAALRLLGDAIEVRRRNYSIKVYFVLLRQRWWRIGWWLVGNVVTAAIVVILFMRANESLIGYLSGG
jgi:hypothetical protein